MCEQDLSKNLFFLDAQEWSVLSGHYGVCQLNFFMKNNCGISKREHSEQFLDPARASTASGNHGKLEGISVNLDIFFKSGSFVQFFLKIYFRLFVYRDLSIEMVFETPLA